MPTIASIIAAAQANPIGAAAVVGGVGAVVYGLLALRRLQSQQRHDQVRHEPAEPGGLSTVDVRIEAPDADCDDLRRQRQRGPIEVPGIDWGGLLPADRGPVGPAAQARTTPGPISPRSTSAPPVYADPPATFSADGWDEPQEDRSEIRVHLVLGEMALPSVSDLTLLYRDGPRPTTQIQHVAYLGDRLVIIDRRPWSAQTQRRLDHQVAALQAAISATGGGAVPFVTMTVSDSDRPAGPPGAVVRLFDLPDHLQAGSTVPAVAQAFQSLLAIANDPRQPLLQAKHAEAEGR